MQRYRWLVPILCWLNATVALAQADGVHIPGKFVRADLVTDDLPAATAFYGEMFGWKFETLPGHAIILGDEGEVGAIFQRDRPVGTDGKPRWVAYMSVPDVSAARQAVAEGGGSTLLDPRTVPGLGTLAVFSDPAGALFGAIHLDHGDPEDYLAEPGEWIWIALTSHEPARAAEFYQRLAPYEVFDNAMSERGGSYLLASAGYARAGLMAIPANRSDLRSAWLPFVRVEDIAVATDTARRLGGRVLVAPRTELANGKAAVVADPTGAAVGLLEWQYTTAPGELQP